MQITGKKLLTINYFVYKPLVKQYIKQMSFFSSSSLTTESPIERKGENIHTAWSDVGPKFCSFH